MTSESNLCEDGFLGAKFVLDPLVSVSTLSSGFPEYPQYSDSTTYVPHPIHVSHKLQLQLFVEPVLGFPPRWHFFDHGLGTPRVETLYGSDCGIYNTKEEKQPMVLPDIDAKLLHSQKDTMVIFLFLYRKIYTPMFTGITK